MELRRDLGPGLGRLHRVLVSDLGAVGVAQGGPAELSMAVCGSATGQGSVRVEPHRN